jgi:hypothetical protein
MIWRRKDGETAAVWVAQEDTQLRGYVYAQSDRASYTLEMPDVDEVLVRPLSNDDPFTYLFVRDPASR